MMLFALMLPSASRVPVTVMVSVSCRSDDWPVTVLRTITLWSKVTLTSVLHRASWMVKLLLVRLVTVPVAPRRAAAALGEAAQTKLSVPPVIASVDLLGAKVA